MKSYKGRINVLASTCVYLLGVLAIIGMVASAEISRSGKALIFPGDQELPDETIDFRWPKQQGSTDREDRKMASVVFDVLNRFQCAIGASSLYHGHVSALGKIWSTGGANLIRNCVKNGCGEVCRKRADWSSCVSECSVMKQEEGSTENTAGYKRGSPMPLSQPRATAPRDKRYRLGLYDCISSYCNKLMGSERKSCIVYYCHRSVGSPGEEEE